MSVPAKPQLRGLLQKQVKKNLTTAILLGITAATAYKFGVAEPRKKLFAEFYKNYDAEAEYEKMKAKGLFQSS